MFKDLKENIIPMTEKMGKFSREMKITIKNYMEILKLRNVQ